MDTNDSHRPFARRLLEGAQRAQAERYSGASIPCYGLPPEWVGPRSPGDSEVGSGVETDTRSGEPVVHSSDWVMLQLVHGVREEPGSPYLYTESSAGIERPSITQLLAALQLDAGSPPTSAEELAWQTRIDGVPVDFHGARSGSFVVGRTELDDHSLTVGCWHWTPEPFPEGLIRIDDHQPYLDGWAARYLPG